MGNVADNDVSTQPAGYTAWEQKRRESWGYQFDKIPLAKIIEVFVNIALNLFGWRILKALFQRGGYLLDARCAIAQRNDGMAS
jgi:hypothetical protein